VDTGSRRGRATIEAVTTTIAPRTLAGGVRVSSIELADGRELLFYDDEHAGADRSPAAVPDLRPLEPHHAASQLRLDPLTREWITVASHRQSRTFLPAAEDNPLAPSRPGHLTEVPAADYDVVVFENRFPSFATTAPDLGVIDADQVPVGEDQRQHLELTRNLAQRFNHRFGPTLRMPEPHIVPAVARIADLADPTAKMSKSGSSPAGLLNVLDEPKVNAKKIRSAVTDTGTEVRADEAAKPGITNLLRIHSALSGRPVESIEAEFAGRGYGDFKAAVAQEVLDAFAPIRERTLELLAKPALLDEALEAGAVRAREVAGATLAAVRDRVGLPAARRTEPGT
jgi:hypothetical protein